MSKHKDRIEEIYCHIADCGLDERGDVIRKLLNLLTLPCLLSLLPARRQHEIAGTKGRHMLEDRPINVLDTEI
jgi:hypothetical protein